MVSVMVGVDQEVTLLLTPFGPATSSIARWMLCPMLGGASNRTTPSFVVRNAA